MVVLEKYERDQERTICHAEAEDRLVSKSYKPGDSDSDESITLTIRKLCGVIRKYAPLDVSTESMHPGGSQGPES